MKLPYLFFLHQIINNYKLATPLYLNIILQFLWLPDHLYKYMLLFMCVHEWQRIAIYTFMCADHYFSNEIIFMILHLILFKCDICIQYEMVSVVIVGPVELWMKQLFLTLCLLSITVVGINSLSVNYNYETLLLLKDCECFVQNVSEKRYVQAG